MPFSYVRTVRLADTDAAGVVYFARTLSICHEAYEAALAAARSAAPHLPAEEPGLRPALRNAAQRNTGSLPHIRRISAGSVTIAPVSRLEAGQ
jgi:hypothetical protein